MNTPFYDLDFDKIECIFETLWLPFLTRYIMDYGFMGVRVDALTHVPALVQQRLFQLVQQLVRAQFQTNAFIVGELMISPPEHYLPALATTGLTHCFNPNSFFWSPLMEGGYMNSDVSPFIQKNQSLSTIVLSSSPPSLHTFRQILINNPSFNRTKPLQSQTIYLNQVNDSYFLALNVETYDICHGKYPIIPLSQLTEAPALQLQIWDYNLTNDSLSKRTIKKSILNMLKKSESLQSLIFRYPSPQKDLGGMVGVIGNHDVGTLCAKVMLDIAYRIAIETKTIHSKAIDLAQTLKDLKTVIKSIRSEEELLLQLRLKFNLSHSDMAQLSSQIPLHMREKIFIQAFMCLGGWYSLAGDEVGFCPKPEVFNQFAQNRDLIGASTLSDTHGLEKDLRGFISGVNRILALLPRATLDDKTSMHQTLLKDTETEEISPHFLFMVVRYSAAEKKYYLIGHLDSLLPGPFINKIIIELLQYHPCLRAKNCELIMIDKRGLTEQRMLDFTITHQGHVESSTEPSICLPTPASADSKTFRFSPMIFSLGLFRGHAEERPTQLSEETLIPVSLDN